MSDRRRKKALDEGTDTVAVIMWEIPMLAAVRSTNWLGDSIMGGEEQDLQAINLLDTESCPAYLAMSQRYSAHEE